MNPHHKIYEKLDYFQKTKKIPHIIFHGNSGTGKKTILKNFIQNIYDNDKKKIRKNVLYVNCAHGKGIKFIREDLKFFAKTNIQLNENIYFKSIVLFNAEFLTSDAQSALRRCIELFSHNTRFFVVVENKQRLMIPILSRFCEIYVPEPIDDNGHIQNLHQLRIQTHQLQTNNLHYEWFHEKMRHIFDHEYEHSHFASLSNEIYEHGFSCLDIMNWLSEYSSLDKGSLASAQICFHKIKSEYRSEKLLMLYVFDYIFLRSNKDIKSISSI
jgi:hypothetical protein|uniref:AAA+ ATPase domain-containing protein n=1 Tax=viral metagenome TaxID=1070528 RepID=A0A6C0IS85_9ZZZZ